MTFFEIEFNCKATEKHLFVKFLHGPHDQCVEYSLVSRLDPAIIQRVF